RAAGGLGLAAHAVSPCYLRQFLAECGLESFLELLRRELVVLRTVLLDLDRAHEARDAARRLPVELVQQAVEEARAIRVAATGRIGNRLRRHDRNREGFILRVDFRAFRPERDDQRVDARRDLGLAPARALLQELPLVV